MNFLLAKLSPAMYNFLLVVKIAFFVIIALTAIVLTIVVIMQSSNGGEGTNVISGVRDSYYAHNHSQTKESILKKITIWCACIIAVLSVALIIIVRI